MKHEDTPNDGSRRPPRGAAGPPPETWLDAFDEQCTPKLLKSLRRLAGRLASRDGEVSDPYYADELVQDAVTDTIQGVLHWDPSTRSLLLHLLNAMRWRARRDRAHAERYLHVPLDAEEEDRDDDDDEPTLSPGDEVSLRAEVLATAAYKAESEDSDARATAITARLRELSAGDPLGLRFLDAIELEAHTRSDIMSLAELTIADYHNTRRRLMRLLQDILAEGI